VYLEVTLINVEVTLINGQNYSIPIDEGHSLAQELELFLNREGRYASDWVPAGESGQRALRSLRADRPREPEGLSRGQVVHSPVAAH
jgi:hypothetical protein